MLYINYELIFDYINLYTQCCDEYDFSSNARQNYDLGYKDISLRLFSTGYHTSIHMFDRNYRIDAFEHLF
jgi:hypothetical protein